MVVGITLVPLFFFVGAGAVVFLWPLLCFLVLAPLLRLSFIVIGDVGMVFVVSVVLVSLLLLQQCLFCSCSGAIF